jgi:pilus assembly protein FimV
MEENGPLVAAGGGGLVALILGWLGLSAYRKKKATRAAKEAIGAMQDEDHPVAAASEAAAYAAVIAESAASDDQETSQFSTTSASIQTTEAAEAVDPLAEADTFLAFGRDAQAEEILLAALVKDPTRQAIHNKLLDIYFGRKNVSQFAAIAEQLRVLTDASGEDWERALNMGREIDPDNALYGGSPPVPAEEFSATMVMEAPVVLEAPPEPVAPSGEAEAMALDFNLDIEAPAESAEPVAAAEPTEAAALDLDFEVQAPESADKPEALDMVLDTGKFEPPAETTEEVVLDLPLEIPDSEPPAAASADGNSVDFEFELKPPAVDAEPPVEATPDVALEMPELEIPESAAEAEPESEGKTEAVALDLGELSEISLDLETPPAPETSDSVDAESVAEMPDNPEVTTKLELATAYEEMGDKDGARELYEEAVKEGSPAQQKQARAKLASLG